MFKDVLAPYVPKEAEKIFKIFQKNSFKLAFVGECVRDWYDSKETFSHDLVTDASLEKIREILKDDYEIIENTSNNPSIVILQNNLRFSISPYNGNSLFEDLKNRDFTINTIAYDGETIYDPFDGRTDRAKHLVRCVINPEISFSQDPMRMLRAIYLSQCLKGRIEADTLKGISKFRDKLNNYDKSELTFIFMQIISQKIYFRETIRAFLDVLEGLWTDYFNFFFIKTMKPSVYESCVDIFETKYPPFYKMAILFRYTLEDSCVYTYKVSKNKDKGAAFYEEMIKKFCSHEVNFSKDFTERIILIHRLGNLLVNKFMTYEFKSFMDFFPFASCTLYGLDEKANSLHMWVVFYVATVIKGDKDADKHLLGHTTYFLKAMRCVMEKSEIYPYKLSQLKISKRDIEEEGIIGEEAHKCLLHLFTKVMWRRLPNNKDGLLMEVKKMRSKINRKYSTPIRQF